MTEEPKNQEKDQEKEKLEPQSSENKEQVNTQIGSIQKQALKDIDIEKQIFQIRRDQRVAASLICYWIIPVVLLCLLLILIIPILTGRMVSSKDFFTNVGALFANVSPFFCSAFGILSSVGISIFGTTHGLRCIGAAIMGSAVLCPRVTTKNLISVVCCEALAIYGVIMSFILIARMTFSLDLSLDYTITTAKNYQMIGSGYCGFGSMSAAIGMGLVGAATVIADSANPKSFVQMVIVEIFLEAIGIFSLVISIIIQFKIDFGVFTIQ